MPNPRQKLYIKPKTKKPVSSGQTHLEKTSPSLNSSPLINMGALRKFQREYADVKDFAGKYRVLRVHWLYVGKGEALPESHQETLSALIGYRYIAQAYQDANFPIPRPVAQNLAALEKNELGSMTPNMNRMMKILTQTSTKQGEDSMVKKADKKESKAGVSQFYLEIFEAQSKAQLTDVQIQAAIDKKTGIQPTTKNVASYRCMYNAGELQGQKAVPAAKVKAVRPPSVKKPKKPMSEETKAKLKAYTAKKKAEKVKSNKK